VPELYVIVSALFNTAVVANAILPAVLVDHSPVGISVICPPVVDIGNGAVMVLIVVVPDTKWIGNVGVIVALEDNVVAV